MNHRRDDQAMQPTKVPFLDLQAHHAPILDEIRQAIDRVIQSNAFAGGPFVTAFEKDWAAFAAAATPSGWATAPTPCG